MYGASYIDRSRECGNCGTYTNVHMLCETCETNVCEACEHDHVEENEESCPDYAAAYERRKISIAAYKQRRAA